MLSAPSLPRTGKKTTIHARSVQGRFNRWRWACIWITQLIFFGGCWLRWDNAGQSRQAILFDIAHEKFYLFDWVFWPQDALLMAFVLILAATGLFWVTSLSGRIFCGFACPQTVYTSLFTHLEALTEGDYRARQKLDQAPWSTDKLLRKTSKHTLWLALALWSGITFTGYFTPLDELLGGISQWSSGPWESFWVVFYAGFMYLQAGFAREAVCQHMCPYSRFQGVMFDPATATVSYDARRGEPRHALRQASTAQGDCVDCGICVQVCPTGIDIRDGLQYQCINCGLCIDACDQVMSKTRRPAGLIRFASEQELAGGKAPQGLRQHPRTLVYASLFVLFAVMAVITLLERPLLRVDVLRDRGALTRESSNGRIENVYTLKLMNLDQTDHDYQVEASGLPDLQLSQMTPVKGPAGLVTSVYLTVSAPADSARSGIHPIQFHIRAQDQPAHVVAETSRFVLP